MCAVSNIGDYGKKTWPDPFPSKLPDYNPWHPTPTPGGIGNPYGASQPLYNGPTAAQFAELITLLKAAKKFDEATGQAHCEQDEKLAWLKAIAKHLGVPEPVL